MRYELLFIIAVGAAFGLGALPLLKRAEKLEKGTLAERNKAAHLRGTAHQLFVTGVVLLLTAIYL